MKSQFRLPLLALALGMSASALPAQSPQIARVTGTVFTHSFDPVVLWGTGLNLAGLEIVSRNLPFDEKEALALLEKGLDGIPRFPNEPPTGAVALKVQGTDPSGNMLSTVLPSARNESRGVLWIRSTGGPWRTYPSTRPQAWWASPGILQPGQVMRVFGRELKLPYMKMILALRDKKSGKVITLTRLGNTDRDASYMVSVKLPEDLPAGEYDVFVHNASGGNANWSEPLPIRVDALPAAAPARLILTSEHGAKPNDMVDDTAGIKAAVAAAAKGGGSTVVFDIGTYLISDTIDIPEGISLKGQGKNLTRITVAPGGLKAEFPSTIQLQGYPRDWIPFLSGPDSAPMFWLRDRSSISHLELSNGPGAGIGILIARSPGVSNQVLIEHMSINQTSVSTGKNLFHGIGVYGNTVGLTIRHNTFTGVALSCIASRHEHLYFGFNKVNAFQHGFPLQANNLVILRGTIRSLIEENEIKNGDRNIVVQSGMKWGKDDVPEGTTNAGAVSYHTAWIGNQFIDNIPRRHNAGEIMFEGGSVRWSGKASKIENSKLEVPEKPFNSNLEEFYVAVVDGQGIGQYRRVVSNTPNSLTLDRPWDILPNAESTLAVGNFVVEHLWIDNTEERTANWTGFWGSHLGHVISGQINRGGEGLYLWANDAKYVVAFIDIQNNWLSDRARIVLLGPGMVFGNTIAGNEIMNFYARPSQHGTQEWASPDPSRVNAARKEFVDREGILLASPYLKGATGITASGPASPKMVYPVTAPYRSWNVIVRNLITNGPRGIVLKPGANYNYLSLNVLNVDGEELVDEGADNIIGTIFGKDGQPE